MPAIAAIPAMPANPVNMDRTKNTLKSTFAHFFDCYCQSLISDRETGH